MRGRVLIHASKKIDAAEIAAANELIHERLIKIPHTCALKGIALQDYPAGGIIGIAEIVDCVTESDSPWFVGPYEE